MNNPNKRNLAYENFRLFSKDSAQSGEALINASSIKLKAKRSLNTERTTLLRNSFKTDTQVMTTSLLVPSEFAWALVYILLNLEIFRSLLVSQTKVLDLNKKDSLITPCCSYIKSMKGALLKGLVTMPDAKEKIHKLENEAVKNNVKIVCLEDHWILRMPKGPSSFILKYLLTSFNTEVVTKKQKPKANLRGLYGYVATQAIKLLPRELQNGAEVFLTGGVAKHRTLQKIFEEKVLLLLNLNLKLTLNISLLLTLLFTYKTL